MWLRTMAKMHILRGEGEAGSFRGDQPTNNMVTGLSQTGGRNQTGGIHSKGQSADLVCIASKGWSWERAQKQHVPSF